MNEKIKKEAMDYFGNKSFLRLFFLIKGKIESREKVSGTVKMTPTFEERSMIRNWLGGNMDSQIITISLSKFEKRLKESKFEDISLWELVELITGSSIILKKERMVKEETQKNTYFDSLLDTYKHPHAQVLIKKIQQKEKGSAGFISTYNARDYETIELILKAISELPDEGKFERLPVFAERITGDPHYFDTHKKIYQALEVLFSEKEQRTYRSKLNSEEEVNLLSLVGLAKDDLHSFVTCYGLRAFRDGKELQQWHWANKERNAQNIPLRSLQSIDQVKPEKGNKVFVLENSGVYSSVLDELKEVYPVVCTHGNFKLSGLLMLDKLVQDGAELYYSGDLDVTGVLMANSLKNRYGNMMHFWRMGREEYLRCVSQVYLPATSMERLNSVVESELKEVIGEMQKQKKAGYQEPLIELYLSDIKSSNQVEA
ncbi:TIGR02679 domain-containing protein [Psychrobacillus sp. NPDC058041]|uniref:TIGR02679 domain-containing protein n=1 Tax=Psychrobacillus sp. NPDC058041 TaxID=3346310 RepID=UPI0036DDCB43